MREKCFCVLNRIEEIEILSILIRFEVQIIKQLDKSFMELSDLDVAWTCFNLALDYGDLSVLFSKQFFLRDEFFIFLFELLIDLVKSGTLLIFFYFQPSSFYLFKLLI